MCLSVCLFVCLFDCRSVRIFVVSVYLSVRSLVRLEGCPSIAPAVSSSVYLPVKCQKTCQGAGSLREQVTDRMMEFIA